MGTINDAFHGAATQGIEVYKGKAQEMRDMRMADYKLDKGKELATFDYETKNPEGLYGDLITDASGATGQYNTRTNKFENIPMGKGGSDKGMEKAIFEAAAEAYGAQDTMSGAPLRSFDEFYAEFKWSATPGTNKMPSYKLQTLYNRLRTNPNNAQYTDEQLREKVLSIAYPAPPDEEPGPGPKEDKPPEPKLNKEETLAKHGKKMAELNAEREKVRAKERKIDVQQLRETLLRRMQELKEGTRNRSTSFGDQPY